MDIVFSKIGSAGHILLSREKALNALTEDMARLMKTQLESWATDDSISSVIIEGAGEKAYCAGGDIRALYDNGRNDLEGTLAFFQIEYNLNALIHYYPKPFYAFINGIAMGGGVGVSSHTNNAIITEKSIVAMPENTIGFIPDVGTTFILSRSPGQIGAYLAMSGARMDASDAIYAGFAKKYVPSDKLEGLKNDLANGVSQDKICATYSQVPPPSKLEGLREKIDIYFDGDDPLVIMNRLKEAGDNGDEWAAEQFKLMSAMSPTSLASSLYSVRLAEKVSTIEECLTYEYRFASRALAGTEFYEGIRALIIDKDKQPKWQPATLEDISQDYIADLFSNLGDGEWQYKLHTF